MRIEVLGPLQVTAEQGPVKVGGHSAMVLAWLAVHANRPVGFDSLGRIVDDGVHPGHERRVRSLVRQLAEALPGVTVLEHSTVCLNITEEDLDSSQFVALAAAARRHWRDGEHEQVAGDVLQALCLWRADPYPELAHLVTAMPEIERLRRIRLGVLEMQQELAMDGGVDFTTVAELRYLAATYPDRLGFRLLLARALHLLDRQADALEVLRRTAADLGGHPASRRLTDMIAHRDPQVASLSVIDVDDDPP